MTFFGFWVVGVCLGVAIFCTELFIHFRHWRWLKECGAEKTRPLQDLAALAGVPVVLVGTLMLHGNRLTEPGSDMLLSGFSLAISAVVARILFIRREGPYWNLFDIRIPGHVLPRHSWFKEGNAPFPYGLVRNPVLYSRFIEAIGLGLVLGAWQILVIFPLLVIFATILKISSNNKDITIRIDPR